MRAVPTRSQPCSDHGPTAHALAITARAALPSVGGSDACKRWIAEGHATIGELFKSAEGRRELRSRFVQLKYKPPSWLESSDHQAQFAGNGVRALLVP